MLEQNFMDIIFVTKIINKFKRSPLQQNHYKNGHKPHHCMQLQIFLEFLPLTKQQSQQKKLSSDELLIAIAP